jgi:iron complex transport system substrate-binding protein
MKKQLFSVVLLVLVCAFAFTACSTSSSPVATTSAAPTPTTESPAEASTTPEAVATPEPTPQPTTRIVLNSDGEEITLPFEVTKAAPAIGAFAQMTEMLTAGSGKISAAAINNISDYFKQVFPDYVQSNPNNYASNSVEDLIASGTQVVYGPSTIFSEEQLAQLASAEIAFVAVNNISTVAGMCESFGIIGSILGEEEKERAADFVAYYQGNIADAQKRTSSIADADKVGFLSLFYSADAYTTINGKDICNEYIEAAGGVNLSKEYVAQAGSNSLTVDAEQVVAWNPQVIMTSSQSGRDKVLSDPALATVDAVKNGDVYVTPYGVYLWSVRSGEGAMLPLWLGTKLYPEQFSDVDMTTVVKDYFNKYYNYDISASELENVLAGDAGTTMTR